MSQLIMMKTYWILVSLVTLFCLKASFAQVTPVSPGSNNRSFQYMTSVLRPGAATSNPITYTWNAAGLPKFYTLAVATTASGFIVKLEGSLDGNNWQQIAITNSATGTVSNTSPMPYLYLRTNASTISAGTAVTATAVGTW